MSAIAVTAAANHQRTQRAYAWLERRDRAEELLIVGASLDAANEIARSIVQNKGGEFGWHRLTLPQLAARIAAPRRALRGLALLGRLGTESIVARLVHRLKAEGRLSRYDAVAATPGFPRAVTKVIEEFRLAGLPSALANSVA